MRLDRLIVRDVFAYKHVDLRTASIGPGLIAITGENGAGKTGLLEVVPAVNYLQLPARENDHPVTYATSREALLEYRFTTTEGHFRALLNLDGQSRGVDGLLQQLDADGGKLRDLNDGKVSTLKKVIAERCPSYELFINSAFAAQGRGDEFARTKPSARKDLFAELLGLERLLALARTSADAAAAVSATRDRLIARRDALRAEAVPPLAQMLDAREAALRADLATAEAERPVRQQAIATLEARLATMQDAVAAFGAATQRIATLKEALAARNAERAQIEKDRETATATLEDERALITTHQATESHALQAKIDGNQQIIGLADQIRAASTTIAEMDRETAQARTELGVVQTAAAQTVKDLRAEEKRLADLQSADGQLTRARTDAELLERVPCGGEDPYAECPLLVNAIRAKARIEDLEATLRPKALIADRIAVLARAHETQSSTITILQQAIKVAEQRRTPHLSLSKYAEPLVEAETRITGYREQLVTLERNTNEALAAAQRRCATRLTELATRAGAIDTAIQSLGGELGTAEADSQATAEDNARATGVQGELAAARQAWDRLTERLATSKGDLDAIARDRARLAETSARLADVERRLARVDQELVEWLALSKDLGKGGLVDLELDAAGPTITATTNALLAAAFDGQFSIELVTQVAKADGSGMKDEFTVRVHDNARGGWRELRSLSGGQKTVVQEALMCALSLYVNERSPHPIQTLWRDETGAALDPVNAIRYVEMLRKVRELGGLHQIYFISHNAEASALADAQIQVGDGTARIVLPPYGPAQDVAA